MYLYKYLNLNSSIYSLSVFLLVYILGILWRLQIYIGQDVTTGKVSADFYRDYYNI